MHNKANSYKYTIEELRPGIWNDPDRFHSPKEYWHLILRLNRPCRSSTDVYEEIKDLQDIFGDVSKRSIKQSNIEMHADRVKGCFAVLISKKKGFWYIDLYLKEEWNDEINIF